MLTGATEQFSILVSETTPFDAALAKLPVLGVSTTSILIGLQQAPILGTVLAPIIGYAVTVPFSSADVPQLTQDVPVAFTSTVTSFDGTPISTNFFPAWGFRPAVGAHDSAATGLRDTRRDEPALEVRGHPRTHRPGVAPLRADGYNVVTWDPRGELASGGVLQLNNPCYEGRDVTAIIDLDRDPA